MHAVLSRDSAQGSRSKEGLFSKPRLLFTNLARAACPIRARTCSLFGHHPTTVRLGRKRHARFESSEALAEQPAEWRVLPCGAARLLRFATGCRLQRRSSVNILTAWPGRVAQAPRAGRALAPWSCWRPSRDAHGWRDQLGLDGESNSKIAEGRHVPSAGHFCQQFANFQRQHQLILQ